MKLDLIWMIYKENSQAAAEAAIYCEQQLSKIGVEVIKVMRGIKNDPFLKLFSSQKQLPN